jgi:NAD(P)-dependent dehydrogenase (short-subunit alcohol dehydrogenase family)
MKKVLITGAGRGIGLALTKEFLAHDFQVVGTYRNESSAKELLQLNKETKNLIPVVADVTNEKTFGPLKEQLSKLGSIDILINNSGVIGNKGSSIREIDFTEFNHVLNVNTLGPMRICQLALQFMKSGAIISHITSQMGSIADNSGGGYYDYRISKAALNMFNKCLSIELPQITCLVLHPGWVQTDMGGSGASVTTKDCASGLFKVITQAKSNQSGHFYDYRGRELPW